MANVRVGTKVMGFFNPIPVNGMYLVKEIDEKNIKLTDKGIEEYRTQELTIRIKKALANFFNVKDDYGIGGICRFYIECVSSFNRGDDIKLFFEKQQSLLILNHHCGKNRNQLFSLAVCVYNFQEFASFGCTEEEVEFVKTNLYEKIKKIEQEVSEVQRVSKADLLTQGVCLIHEKHINLNGHFSKFSEKIQLQAKRLIVDLAEQGDFQTIGSLSQMLVAKNWYGVHQLVSQRESRLNNYDQQSQIKNIF